MPLKRVFAIMLGMTPGIAAEAPQPSQGGCVGRGQGPCHRLVGFAAPVRS